MKPPNDTVDVDLLERPKTPQAPEPSLYREPNLQPAMPFPFFSGFPSAPGLIPHPIFPRFPLPLGRGVPGPHPAMPNLPIPPRFLNPPIKLEDFPLPKIKSTEREKPPIPMPMDLVPSSILGENEKMDKEKVDNKHTKIFKANKESPFIKVPERIIAPPVAPAPVAPVMLSTPLIPNAQILPSKNPKTEKAEKNDTVTFIKLYCKKHVDYNI